MNKKTKFISFGLAILLSSFSTHLSANENNETNSSNVIIDLPKVPKPTTDLPKVPQPIKVITNGETSPVEEIIKKKNEIVFSTKRPSDLNISNSASEYLKKNSSADVGDIKNSRISLYMETAYMESSEVEKILKDKGFDILSTHKLDKSGDLLTIVYTNGELIKLADKPNRAFASSLRILVDKKNSKLHIMNPLYVTKAYLQNENDENVGHAILTLLRDSFKDLKNSKDVIKYNLLEDYCFMAGMAKYNDMLEVGRGEYDELFQKVKKNKNVIYVQELSKNRAIVGMNLTNKTAKFVDKIGEENSALLPYPVLIENNKAFILDPKYYIAIMYPMLKIDQFMTISTIPEAIQKEVKKVFK